MSVLTAQAKWSAQGATGIIRVRTGNMTLGLLLAALMGFTIAGTLVAGKIIAFASIPVYIMAVLVLSVRDPAAALAVYFSYAAMEGMFKYLSNFNSVIYIIKPVLLLLVAWGWMVNNLRRKQPLKLPPMSRTVAVLLLWGVAQIFHPLCRGIASGVSALLIWYTLPALLMPLGANVFRSADQEERLRYALVFIGIVVSLLGILQFALGQDWTMAHFPGYDSITSTNWWTTDAHGVVTYASFRPASTTAEGGAGGYWGHIGAMICLPMIATPGLAFRTRVLLVGCILINVLGMMVCGVRLYVVLGLFEGACWIFLTARSLRELARNLGFACFALLAVGGSFLGAQALSGGHLASRYAETIRNPFTKLQSDRGENFAYLPKFLGYFPLGIGYQRSFGGKAETDSTEGDIGELKANRETEFNSIADDMGLPGLILVVLLLIGIPKAGFRALRSLRGTRMRLVGALYLSMLLGYVLMSFAGPSLQGADFFWLFAGSIAALPLLERRELQASQPKAPNHQPKAPNHPVSKAIS